MLNSINRGGVHGDIKEKPARSGLWGTVRKIGQQRTNLLGCTEATISKMVAQIRSACKLEMAVTPFYFLNLAEQGF